jgi:ferredoxin
MITATEVEHCALCPRLCRHACPVAVATGREAATPTAIATILLRWTRGSAPDALAAAAATLCTDCGACEDACGIDRPVVAQLQAARAAVLPAAHPETLRAVEGGASTVAIECDNRAWGPALAAHLGHGVARLQTTDHLGTASLDSGALTEDHIATLRNSLAGRTAVVACHGCARVVEAAGIETVHLAEMVTTPSDARVHRPCNGPQLAGASLQATVLCCGAGGPLAHHHPDMADDVGHALAAEFGTQPVVSPDARCANHLRKCGAVVADLVDLLMRDTQA